MKQLHKRAAGESGGCVEPCRNDECQWLTKTGHCSLKQMTARLVMGLRGQGGDVDEELDQLVGAIDANLSDEQIELLLHSLAHRMEHLKVTQASSVQQTCQAFESWGNQLSAMSSAHWLPQLDQHNPELVVQLLDIAALMQELVRLYSASLFDDTASKEVAPLGEIDDFVSTESDRLVLEVLISRIGREIAQLLDKLEEDSKPGSENQQLLVEKLKRRVRKGLQPEKMPEVMVELVSLIKMASGVEIDPFEQYLLKLNSQLFYLRRLTEDIYAYRREDEEGRLRFRSGVTEILQELLDENVVTDDSRRQRVQEQMTWVQTYGREHHEREARVQISYDVFLRRIDEMEHDAAQMKTRMVAEHLRASTDALTGLPNRVAYNEQIERDMQRWRRYRSPFSLAVVDLDLFKSINDTYGHQAGDKVLRQVGRLLRRHLRAADFVARYGGEEFVILFPSTSVTNAELVANDIRRKIGAICFCFGSADVTVTVSIGVTEIRADDSRESLFGRADASLYQAKRAGRNQVVAN